MNTAETWTRDGDTYTSCSLPSLPDFRFLGSLDGTKYCGGGLNESQTSCLEFCQGSWKVSDSDFSPRLYHTSWRTEDGVYLMGGEVGYTENPGGALVRNGLTTTFIGDDGTISRGFDLDEYTR